MTDVILVVVIVAFFTAAALLVRVIDHMIAGASEADGGAGEDDAAELEPGSRA